MSSSTSMTDGHPMYHLSSPVKITYHYFPYIQLGYCSMCAGFLSKYFESFLHALDNEVSWPPHPNVTEFFAELNDLFREYCAEDITRISEEAHGFSCQVRLLGYSSYQRKYLTLCFRTSKTCFGSHSLIS